ncbi:EAL domain-containing protein [Novosphingobium sp. FKTRR1]|uniref:EAL domain-containing protein n=1 Tax=Novosphingobium sp. FKTRR1 TaxID=2879118 RepID=UPI00272E8624|nr:EAL domain-containing protein [Novosphingobium sp. FKTRR1]
MIGLIANHLSSYAKAAALICGTPIALVSLVDEKRQWFKANVGLTGVSETPRNLAFCAHAILGDSLFEVPDTTVDPRFADNPLVTGAPGIRFYAGAPLRLSSGEKVGTLCVIDHQARKLTDGQREALTHLSAVTAKSLEGRFVVKRLQTALDGSRFNESGLRLVVDNAPSMMAYWDKNLNCVFANRAYERWFGVHSDSIVGINIEELLGPELYELSKQYIAGALAGEVQTFERVIPGTGGINRHSLAYYVPDIVDGEVVGFLVQVSDLSALKHAEQSLQEAQRLGHIGSWEWSPQSDRTVWSAELYRITGRDPALPPPTFAEHGELYTPESWKLLQNAVNRALQLGEPYTLELEFAHPDGTARWLEARGEARFDATRSTTVLRGTVQDITLRRKLVAELAEQHELLRVTLQSIGDAVITTDAQGAVTWLNPVAAQMVGWSSVHAKGRPLDEVFCVVDEESRLPCMSPIDQVIGQGRITGKSSNTVLISRTGKEYDIQTTAAPIRSEADKLLGVVVVFHDVTEQRRQSKEITYRAQHDALTGLVNRAEFDIRLQRALHTAKTKGLVHTLMYIDLDQFKIVNDMCGHAAGDRLLQNVANLLRGVARERDTIARLGGDEFGLLLEHCTYDNAQTVAQQICHRLDDSRFLHDGKRFRISASIGLVPIDAHWKSPIAIMQAADRSCYAAKEAGRNRVHAWFEKDEALLARQCEMQWAARLESAFDEDRFRLYAQRIVPLDGSGGGHHLEVLLRLVESDGTVFPPGAFLPAAERFNLATRIDRLVLRKVVERLAARLNLSAYEMVCVNISGQSIGDRAFHREAIRILSAAGPTVCQRICLEITETVAITNMTEARVFIEQVHRLGVRIALDDFGAGAATFGYLKSLPIDVLKIDGQFVQDLISDPLNEAAMRCFVDMARIMGVKVVAECVETEAIAAHLTQMGVNYGQGYLFHRPEPFDNILI